MMERNDLQLLNKLQKSNYGSRSVVDSDLS